MAEIKISALRQFGSENISVTTTVQSEKDILSDEEIQAQVDQVTRFIEKSFKAAQEREISEKALLVAASERRTTEVKKLDDALKEEMKVKEEAQRTIKQAERQSDRITKSQSN